MQRKFLINLAILLSLNLLVKPFYIFFIDMKVQNIVGAEEFGFYFSLFNFSMLFNIFLDMGITNYNNRNISRHRHLLNKYFSGIVGLRFVLAVVYAGVLFLVAIIAGYNERQLYFLIFLSFNQFLIWFIFYLRSNIAGLHLFKTDSIISVLDRLVMILICGYLILSYASSGMFRIEWFVYCQTASYFLTAIVALLIVIRKSAFRRLNWDIKFFRVVLRQSFPFALLTLLMVLYNRIDSVLLERLLPGSLGATQAGIYAAAFRILDAVVMVSYLFSVLLLPIFSRMIKLKEKIDTLVRLAFSLLLIIAGSTALISLLYNNEIMSALYNQFAADSAHVFPVIMLCFIPISITYIFGTLLTANGNMRLLNITALAGVIVNVILNLILIPVFFAYGSGIASLISQSLAAIIQMLIAFKIFKLHFGWRYFLRLLMFFISITITGIGLRYYCENWLVGIMLTFIMVVVLAFLFRLIRFKSLWLFLHKQSDETS
ncbi:MAG: oligosaccharide flippase family protein [Bacteroidales bacterium]|nr:oligosaccharide flippase family protein [Bacteroidales bacterium]